LFAFAKTMLTLIVARIVQGIAAAASWTAALALLADLFSGKSRGAAMGIALTGISTGSLLGAPIGGWLFEMGGYELPFFFSTGLIVLNFVLVLLLLKEPTRSKCEANQGVLPFLRNRSVLFIACIILLAETTLTLLEPLLPMHLTQRLAITPVGLGLLFGVMTLAYGVIAPVSGALSGRYNPYALMLIGLVLLSISLQLLVIPHTLWQTVLVMILVGAVIGFTLSPTLSTLGGIVDRVGRSGDYGSAYALFNMFHAIGMIAGPIAGGVLTDFISIPAALIAVGAGILLCAALMSVTLIPKKKGTMGVSGKKVEVYRENGGRAAAAADGRP
jgi:predicted MFS family arabinose efflux permease